MAERSVVGRLAAEVKVAAAVTFVIVVALTPRGALTSLATQGLVIAAVAVLARLPGRYVARRAVVCLPFLVSSLALALVAGGPRMTVVGPVSVSEAGLAAGAAIAAKIVIGTLTSIVLAGTTPTPELVAGLGRLRLPAPMVAVATLMVRYLDLTVDELRRRRLAMASRGFRARWLGHAGPLASTLGVVFVRTYERGERVQAAMVSRGFTGTMPPSPPDRYRPTAAHWVGAAALPAAGALAALTPWLAGR